MSRGWWWLVLAAGPAFAGKAKEPVPTTKMVCAHLVDVGVAAYAVPKDEAMTLACEAEFEIAGPSPGLDDELRCAIGTTVWSSFASCGPTVSRASATAWPFRTRIASVCRHMLEVVDRETGVVLSDDDRRKRNETCKQDLRDRWSWLPPAEASAKAACVEKTTTILAADACF